MQIIKQMEFHDIKQHGTYPKIQSLLFPRQRFVIYCEFSTKLSFLNFPFKSWKYTS